MLTDVFLRLVKLAFKSRAPGNAWGTNDPAPETIQIHLSLQGHAFLPSIIIIRPGSL